MPATSTPAPAASAHRRRALLTLALAAFALSSLLIAPLAAAAGNEATTYGTGITLEETTPIATLVADPKAYEGKRVRVEGKVNDVCPAKGCWMSLGSTDNASIRIKVQDDVIVFPQEAKTHHATAEGVVEVIELDRERYASWLEHLAAERKEPFDPATVGDGPYRIVQIRGEGAEIDLP